LHKTQQSELLTAWAHATYI